MKDYIKDLEITANISKQKIAVFHFTEGLNFVEVNGDYLLDWALTSLLSRIVEGIKIRYGNEETLLYDAKVELKSGGVITRTVREIASSSSTGPGAWSCTYSGPVSYPSYNVTLKHFFEQLSGIIHSEDTEPDTILYRIDHDHHSILLEVGEVDQVECLGKFLKLKGYDENEFSLDFCMTSEQKPVCRLKYVNNLLSYYVINDGYDYWLFRMICVLDSAPVGGIVILKEPTGFNKLSQSKIKKHINLITSFLTEEAKKKDLQIIYIQ